MIGPLYASEQRTFSARGTIASMRRAETVTAPNQRNAIVLYTIAVILLIFWLLGLVTSVTMGGFIHVLLVVAIVVVLLRVISGRSPI